ncbi:MAG: CofH family radical SAM protein [Opitutales bacterium]|nr:CofH family radical SAM protein [Opitutales bacterium]
MGDFSALKNFDRISTSEALRLLDNAQTYELGERANTFKTSLYADTAFYAVNAAITYSNICEACCPICSFFRREGEDGAYLLSPDDVYERAKTFSEMGAEEIHIIGGIYRKLDFNYYLDVVRAVKKADKNLNVVSYTVSECALMAEVSGKSLEEIIEKLIEAGTDALPGGGAEIFDAEIRRKISPNKLTAQQWLDAMRVAHKLGLKTNATMLYGHLETSKDIVCHLDMLRSLQDETGGFKAFVPLPFRQGASVIKGKSSGIYDLKICAISRLMLDNFPHIRIPVPHFGDRLSQILLNFGADDIGGTHWNEEVAVAAGATKQKRTVEFMRGVIEGAGLQAKKTNSNYV